MKERKCEIAGSDPTIYHFTAGALDGREPWALAERKCEIAGSDPRNYHLWTRGGWRG